MRWKIGVVVLGAVGLTAAGGLAAWSYAHRGEEAGWTGIEACVDLEPQSGSVVQIWPLASGQPVMPPNDDGARGIWRTPTWITDSMTIAPPGTQQGPAFEDFHLPAGRYLIQDVVPSVVGAFTTGTTQTVEVVDGWHVIWECAHR